jgi:rhodanese-related sulfurtransferase
MLQVAFLFSCNSTAQTGNISIDAFEKGIKEKDIQLLDVRTAGEYNDGHLSHSLQANWNNQAEFVDRVKALDKSKPVYTYCLSGGRSSAAMDWLKENGFKTVFNLKGGINAWKQANKPVEAASNVVQMTMDDYLKLIPADKTVLVDFGAEWCPPCKKMKPIMDSLQKQNHTIINIDGGKQTAICKAMNVDAFPVFIVYKNGKEIGRKNGLQDYAALETLFLQ